MTVTFTTTQNQKNNLNNNMTSIDLGECEILLRKYYNLTDNDTLYMKKLDIIQEGLKIPKVEFDVYCKLNGSNLVKLNLSVCQNSKMILSVPVEIEDNLDKLNKKSDYCNDICYSITENGTDIILRDRKNECIIKMVCQDDCDFSNYDYTSKNVNCSCKVKESSSSFADIKIDTNELLSNIKNIKNVANLNILECYKKLFSKKGLIKNIGFYIFIVIIIIRIINLFIFYFKQLDLLKNKIKDLIYAINNYYLLKMNKKKEEPKKKQNRNIDNINNVDNIDNETIVNNNNKKKVQKKNNKKENINTKIKKRNKSFKN